MTIEQLKIMQAIGAIKAFYEVRHPLKRDELRDRLKRRAPLISSTMEKCVEMFRIYDLPEFQKERSALEKAYSSIETLSTQQTLMRAAFPEEKPPATSPFTKSINLTEREEATLLRDWLDFMLTMNNNEEQPVALHSRLEMTLMCMSYAMLELR